MASFTIEYFAEENSNFPEVPASITEVPSAAATMTWHLDYCPPHANLNRIWIQKGFSHCFLETAVDAVSLSFILVFGIIQIWFYRKYSTPVKHYELPYSQLFGVQMMLNGLMPLISMTHFALNTSYPPEENGFYGYMILSLIQGFIVWPMLCVLVLQERNHLLPTVPRKGHGLILLIIWTWMFAAENLLFMNILSPNWFFSLNGTGDIIRFVVFVIEYLMTGAILAIGIRAPGIPSFQNSDSFMRLISNEYVSYSALTKTKAPGGAEVAGNGGSTGSSTMSTGEPAPMLKITEMQVPAPKSRGVSTATATEAGPVR